MTADFIGKYCKCDTNVLFSFQILRLMKGYDEFNTILLPPRPAGEKLPQELMEYYEGRDIVAATSILKYNF